MEKKRIFLSPPSANGHELQAVVNAINSNWIAPLGPYIDKLERNICNLTSAKHAVAVSSGTAALHLALLALGVQQGDTVFCSDLTFAGSCFPILYLKANPIFIDSKDDGWGMSETALEKAFYAARRMGNLPKAVIIVDLYGQSADYDRLLPICDHYGVPVIEDAAEAVGSRYNGQACGTFGKLNMFSFNGNKIITTSGGGMLLSDDGDLLDKAKFWSTQSKEPELFYQHKEVGYNYRMSNICAAIGVGQLETLQERIDNRKAIYNRYREAFRSYPVRMMPLLAKGDPNYWLSVLTIEEDVGVCVTDVIMKLQNAGIESRYAWKPMHLQPVFQHCPFYSDAGVTSRIQTSVSIGEWIFRQGLCLPSGTDMSQQDQDEIIDVICGMFSAARKDQTQSIQVGA